MRSAPPPADDATALAGVVRDPVRFCRGLLRHDLWPLQEDILQAVASRSRVAVKACHASGKTFVAAVAVLWFVTRYRDGIVVTTAPTWTQVENLLWGEIHRAVQSSRIAFPQLNKTELRIGPGNYALGLSTNEGVRFQGFHGRILIVIDEAPGVKADIWESIEGIRAGGDVHVLALYAEGRRQGLKRANSLGLTSVFEANATPGVLQAYQDRDSSNELTSLVVAALETKPLEGVSQVSNLVAKRSLAAGRRLRPTAAKIFVDGIIEGRTAALLQPYVGTDDRGLLNFPPSKLNQLVTALAKEGFQVHFHAIGDRAVQAALDSVEASQATALPDLRHNVAHLELVRPEDLPRFHRLAVVANFQPRWAYEDEDIRELTQPLVGPERSERLYPIGSVLRTGARIAAGSDWPVSSLDPLEGIQVAVTRRALDAGPGAPWLPNETISLMDVVAAYTINGAYALHQEKETGSVEVGKLADLVVLDRNLFQESPDSLSRARVLRTFVEGEEVYTAPGLAGS